MKRKRKISRHSKAEIKQHETLFDTSSSQDEVAEFVKSCCRHCFTLDNIWGTRKNLNKFLSVVDKYVRLSKGETLAVANLTDGIRTGSLSCFRNTLSCLDLSFDNINFMFAKLMYWIFSSFINPLLAASFYITEGEGLGMTLLYYRKSSWTQMVNKGCTQVDKSFMKVVMSISGKNEGDKGAEYVYRGRGLAIDQWWHFPNSCHEEDVSSSKPLNELSSKESSNCDDPVTKRARLPLSNASKAMLSKDVDADECFHNRNFRAKSSNISVGINNIIPAIRFVPKKTSVRAITNMRMKQRKVQTNGSVVSGRTVSAQSFVSNISETSSLTASLPSTNPVVTQSSLYSCLHIFRHMHNLNRHLIGFGVLGMDDIYTKIKNYHSHISSLVQSNCDDFHNDQENKQDRVNSQCDEEHAKQLMTKTEPFHKFYMAVLDLEKCYDNVDTCQLYDIMKKVMQTDSKSVSANKMQKSNCIRLKNFTVHKYNATHYIPSTERVVTKNLRYVTQSDELSTFKGMTTLEA